MNRPLITVLGATGVAGGSLVRALLADPARPYAVRAVTRRPSAPVAAALAAAGCEVVQADLDDRASLERAFAGSHGVFAVTDVWAHRSPDRELARAENLAAAAQAARVAHVIWSTLEQVRKAAPLADARIPTGGGRWNAPLLHPMGAANRCFVKRGVPVTFLLTPFFWDNLIHFGMGPQRGADGALELLLPMGDAPLPGIAAADIGPVAIALFARRTWTLGRLIGIAGEHLDGTQMAAALGRAIGEPVRYVPPTPAQYAGLGFAGAADLADMFAFTQQFNATYCARRDVAATRMLHPGLQGFDAWLGRHAAQIPIPAAALRA